MAGIENVQKKRNTLDAMFKPGAKRARLCKKKCDI